MPKYKSIQYNAEVMDVLCCVIMGCDSVKSITKKLKQPQSTVSEKLRFLRDSKAVVKDKWEFKPNWKAICKLAKVETRDHIENLGGGELGGKMPRRKLEEFVAIFDDKRTKRVMETYADYFQEGWLEKASISDIIFLYFQGLSQMDDNNLKKHPELLRFKRFLGIGSMERAMFEDVEEG